MIFRACPDIIESLESEAFCVVMVLPETLRLCSTIQMLCQQTDDHAWGEGFPAAGNALIVINPMAEKHHASLRSVLIHSQ